MEETGVRGDKSRLVPVLLEIVPEKLSKEKGMLLSLTKPQLYIWKKGMVVAGRARHRSNNLQSCTKEGRKKQITV